MVPPRGRISLAEVWTLPKAMLSIQGMTCNHCKLAVTRALEAVAGVVEAEVDLQAGRAQVTYDGDEASVEKLKAAVEEAGYTVTSAA